MIPAPIYVRVMGNLFNGMIAGEPILSISTGTRLTSLTAPATPKWAETASKIQTSLPTLALAGAAVEGSAS